MKHPADGYIFVDAACRLDISPGMFILEHFRNDMSWISVCFVHHGPV